MHGEIFTLNEIFYTFHEIKIYFVDISRNISGQKISRNFITLEQDFFIRAMYKHSF